MQIKANEEGTYLVITDKYEGIVKQVGEYEFEVESRTNRGQFYTVLVGEENSCDCQGFANHKNCEHVKIVYAFIERNQPEPEAPEQEEIKTEPKKTKETKSKTPSFLKKATHTKPHLKACFDGFAGSGKTYTMARLAIGLHQRIKSKKPVVMQDTEQGHKHLAKMFSDVGIELEVIESRSLADTKRCMEICRGGYSDIFLIDSISHIWQEYVEAFKANKSTYKNMMTIQDWGVIKPRWAKNFSTPFVFDPYHIIFCGRAGYEYGSERNEDTGKREFYVKGVKMRAETETAFEPDLTVFMERFEKIIDADENEKRVWRVATVQKSRFPGIDGMVFRNPTYKDFSPAVEYLLSNPKASELQEGDTVSLFPEKDDTKEWVTDKTIILEEIKQFFMEQLPGTGEKIKAIRGKISQEIFGSSSWTFIEKKVSIENLKAGLVNMKKLDLKKYMESE